MDFLRLITIFIFCILKLALNIYPREPNRGPEAWIILSNNPNWHDIFIFISFDVARLSAMVSYRFYE